MTKGLRPALGPGRALALALGFGLCGYAAELVFMLASDASEERAELLRRALRFLPWQLGAFAAIGAGVALLAALRRLPSSAAGWLVLFGASWLFAGARVAEGAIHTGGGALAALRLAAMGAGLAALVSALAWLARALPGAAAAAFARGTWVAWGVLGIAYLRSAGAAIALGELGLSDALARLRPADAALALAAGGAAFALSLLRGRAAAPLLLAAFAAALGAGAAPSRTGATDVYVILLDTLRHDHLGPQPGGADRTPALSRLAPEFVRFRSAWSPSTRTSRSMPGIMTSLSVRVTGAALPPQAVTLAERLRDAGWRSYGVSANPLVSAQFGYDQGFDRLAGLAEVADFLVLPVLKLVSTALPAFSYDLGIAKAELYYPPLGPLRQQALRFLDASPAPSFVYVQSMDVHGPYLPPPRFLPPGYRSADFLSYYDVLDLSGTPALGAPELAPQLENLRQRYAGGVSYTDEQLASFIDDLRARGRWDEALVWILSDHGEAFGEHGFAGHGQTYVGSAVVRVPLWLKLPASWGIAPREIEATVSTYDVLPTTLSLLGLPPLATSFGSDLSPLLRGAPADPARTVVVETDDRKRAALYAAVRGRFKLDVHFARDGSTDARTLYDLAEDSAETTDVAPLHPEVADSLEAEVRVRRAAERKLSFRKRKADVDPQMRERLRSLGYVDE